VTKAINFVFQANGHVLNICNAIQFAPCSFISTFQKHVHINIGLYECYMRRRVGGVRERQTDLKIEI